MTTTNYTVGIGNDEKISSKVLKPPGGETHDIFGTSACHVEAVPHRNTNHLQSSVFREAAGQSPADTVHGKRHSGNHAGGASTIVFGSGVDEAAVPPRNTEHLETSVFREAAGQSPAPTVHGRRHAGNHAGGASTIVFGAGVDEKDEQPRQIKDYQKSNLFGEQNEPSYLNGNSGIRRYNAAGLANSQVFPTGCDMTPRTAAKRAYGNPITGEGYANGAAADNGNANEEQAKENGQSNSGVRIRNPPGGHSTRLW